MERYDCCGWVTRNDLKCADGRIIRHNAFKDCDGMEVPLVWNHQHHDVNNILGHALLENRDEGVYGYCTFNDTESGQAAKKLVQHGDVKSFSIYANRLKEQAGNVYHGMIREVSLVIAGANPGAYIESVIQHGEEVPDEAKLFYDQGIELYHAENMEKETNEMATEPEKKTSESEETVADVFNTLTDKQKTVVYALVAEAMGVEDDDDTDMNHSEEDNTDMKYNVFEGTKDQAEGKVLTHAEEAAIFADAKRMGSLRDASLEHGVENLEYLFPDHKNVTGDVQFIERDTGWVSVFMRSVHRSPFARVKSIFADITEDQARARGYIKGKFKKEEVFSLLKRTTDPTTVYKKQKLHRDDVADITDYDAVRLVKGEMRKMLDEEIARAAMVGDGRLSSDDDKIDETRIRPIWTDSELFTIPARFDASTSGTAEEKAAADAKAFIRAAIRARKNYKGSGNPTLFTTEDVLTECLLLTDEMGRDLYDTPEKLMKKLRVSAIVTVPVMEGLSRQVSGVNHNLFGIIVNLADYNIGADKGGAVSMFDDFDIDFNAMKYLIETRCSGALTKPYSAIVVEAKQAG